MCEERSDEAISRKIYSSASREIASPRKNTGARTRSPVGLFRE